MAVRTLAIWLALTLVPACAARHGGPVIDNGSKPPSPTGTIAGTVTADSAVALSGRKVTATAADSGYKYAATTATNGGYTIKVPAGHRYRLDVEVRSGETLQKQPDPTDVTAGDVDPDRNFVIGARR
jgi:hypothetical protein